MADSLRNVIRLKPAAVKPTTELTAKRPGRGRNHSESRCAMNKRSMPRAIPDRYSKPVARANKVTNAPRNCPSLCRLRPPVNCNKTETPQEIKQRAVFGATNVPKACRRRSGIRSCQPVRITNPTKIVVAAANCAILTNEVLYWDINQHGEKRK